MAGCSQAVSDGQGLRLGQDVHITCIHTPGCATERDRQTGREGTSEGGLTDKPMLLVLGGQAHDGPYLLLCQASGPRQHHQQRPDSSSSSRSGRGVYRRHTGEEEAGAVAAAQAAQSNVDSLSGSLTHCLPLPAVHRWRREVL